MRRGEHLDWETPRRDPRESVGGRGIGASGAFQLAVGLAMGLFGGAALMLLDRGAYATAVFFGLVALALAALVFLCVC
jgi:hypothetical protein